MPNQTSQRGRIRALHRNDAAQFRAIRLESLRMHPEFFGSSLAEEEGLSEADFARRIPEAPPDAVFGAFQPAAEGSSLLVGLIGFHTRSRHKQRHKAGLSGMYVRPAYAGAALPPRSSIR